MTARTLAEIAALVGATVEGDGTRLVVGPAALAEAGPQEVSFLAHPRYRRDFEQTRAAGVLVRPDVRSPRPDLCLLRCADPSAGFSAVVTAFAEPPPRPPAGVHPTAVVHPAARIEDGATIGPHCLIEEGARVGARCLLQHGVFVGAGARVGEDSTLYAGVVLYRGVTVGRRCILHAGCVVGSDGFGFEPSPAGWTKIPQCGTVLIGDDVEIGANTTIDRGRFGATRVGSGAKIDNLVHVGHNCMIGEGALLCAQAGLAGSARVGSAVVLGGQVGVGGHVSIGDRARVAAQAGVMGDLEGGAEYLGFPARPRMEALRNLALPKQFEKLAERVRELEMRLEERGGPRP